KLHLHPDQGEHGRRDPRDLLLLDARPAPDARPVQPATRRLPAGLGRLDPGPLQRQQPPVHGGLPAPDHLLHILLRGDHIQPDRGRGQHEEVWWIHPGHPCRQTHRGLPVLRVEPHHVPRGHLPWPDRLDTTDRVCPDQGRPELPVRWRLRPHHGRCGTRDGQADQCPDATATLRRTSAMTRLLIVGPPGSGKGTQAARISERLGIVAISTGDIFRANVKGGTPLGVEAKQYMDAGDYVPDSVTNRMVRDRLKQDDVAEGFLLDGYPRTAAQVDELDAILEENGTSLDVVLQLTADQDELVARLLKRAQIEGRADDTEDVIRHRLDVYEQQTQVVVDRYLERGIVRHVDGLGDIDAVTERVLGALEGTAA